MILSFLKYGQGKGRKPVAYACDRTKPNGIQRSVAPKILEGEARTTRQLIDACANKWKYTSAVISFTPDEFTEDLARKVLADFKTAAFPGLEPHQYDLLAVLHLDTANPHIHLIAPRLELSTGKALNIAPPGSQLGFWADWSACTRDKHKLRQVEELPELDKKPLTKFEKQIFSKALDNFSFTIQKLKIDENLRENIANGLISNRDELINYLKISGFEIARITENSISLKTTNKNMRLEGGIYANTKSGDRATYAEIASAAIASKSKNRGLDGATIDTIKGRFKKSLAIKSNYFAKVYRSGEQENRGAHKKLLSQNARRASNAGKQNFSNSSCVASASSSLKSNMNFANDLDSRISEISARLNNANPENSAALAAELGELISQKMMASAETMSRGYRL